MGNPKLKWTTEEEEALKKGVLKHGAGKWKIIQKDPEFNQVLFSRSNIDLKDKWRNLTVANGTGSGEKLKTPKAKANHVEVPAILPPSARVAPAATLPHDPSTDAVMKDSSRSIQDGSGAAKLNVMIFEALLTLNQPNGSDSSAIADSIKQKYEVPENFNRTLSCRLRRLVQQNKLEKVYFAQQDKQEKVRNFYRMKNSLLEDSVPVPHPRPPSKSQKDTQTRPLQFIGHVADETVEEAAESAAYAIAEAEHQSYVAAKAVKEAERVSSMEEETESFLGFAMYCFEQSAQGEMMIMV